MAPNILPMWQRTALLPFLFPACLCAVMAQEPIGLRINSLTSAERDALTANARQAGELEVVFACVPAGVIVFNGTGPAGSREALRTKVLALATPVIPAPRITEAALTLPAAEAACRAAREQ